jgi:ATP-dependent DNA helicase RecG
VLTRPYDVTVDDLLDPEHTSKPRNKLIAQIFYDMKLIERYGSGIQRILDSCREEGVPFPLFENFSGGFRIKFMLAVPVTGEVIGDEGVSEGVTSLLSAIEAEPGHRLPFYAKSLDSPARTVERWIQKLRDKEQIEFRGAPRTGGYYPAGG